MLTQKIEQMKKVSQCLLIALSAIVLVRFAASCKKEPEVYDNGRMKIYFGYQTGSYWVFYDSLSNNYDSFRVVGIAKGPPILIDYLGSRRLLLDHYNLNNTVDSLAFTFSFYLGSTSAAWVRLNGGMEYYAIGTNMPSNNKSILYPEPGYVDSAYRVSTFLPTFSIGSTAYSNVYKVEFSYTHMNSSYEDVFYFNEDQGFIAFLLNDHDFRKKEYLVRSSVVKSWY